MGFFSEKIRKTFKDGQDELRGGDSIVSEVLIYGVMTDCEDFFIGLNAKVDHFVEYFQIFDLEAVLNNFRYFFIDSSFIRGVYLYFDKSTQTNYVKVHFKYAESLPDTKVLIIIVERWLEL